MPGVPFYSILLQILITDMTDIFNIGCRVSMGGALVAAADVVICNKTEQFTDVIFMVVPCILISSKSFIHQQMHHLLILENYKIYIKT
jgi:hypothetical protein